jgi:hypothetical protein
VRRQGLLYSLMDSKGVAALMENAATRE